MSLLPSLLRDAHLGLEPCLENKFPHRASEVGRLRSSYLNEESDVNHPRCSHIHATGTAQSAMGVFPY